MEVVTGRASGIAHMSDHVTAIHLRARLHCVVEQMPVASLQTETVIENKQVSIPALIADLGDRSGCRGKDRLPPFARDVQTGMEIGAPVSTAFMPRCMPSVGFIATVLTRFSPRCCSTSTMTSIA